MSSEDEKSRYCLHCSKKLTYQKRYCSIQCIGLYKQNSNYVKRGEYRHKCSECNQKFIGSFKSQYCSYSCRHMQPAKSKLSYERLLTSEVQEVLDGYLLGDGFLGQEGNRSGRLTIQQQHKEFAQYIANFFEMYFEPDKAIVKYGKKEDDRLKSGYSEFYRIRTLSQFVHNEGFR